MCERSAGRGEGFEQAKEFLGSAIHLGVAPGGSKVSYCRCIDRTTEKAVPKIHIVMELAS